MGTRKPATLALIGLAWFLVANGVARAQGACGLQTRVPFEGHVLPLESTPAFGSMKAVNAFPNLTFFRPLAIMTAPDDSDRIFVVGQKGTVWVFQNDPTVANKKIFLDISEQVHSTGNQQGLFHLAFDPNYASNGYFYLSYTASAPHCAAGNNLCAKVSRFSVSPADPDSGDPTSGIDLIDQPHVADFHYVTALAFGPDGYLYVGWGDGTHFESVQAAATVLGTILRVDPHGGTPYAVPPDNPFVGDPNKAPEIWHYGLRHPWRFSFDRLTGDLWIADVGANAWEEVDFVPAGAPGGLNFGWAICEGTHDFLGGDCSSIDSVRPVIEYPHGDLGFSVIGGYVYRGSQFPQLYGRYIFGDFVSGRIWAWDGVSAEPTQIATASYVNSFGEDGEGELYIVRRTSPGEIDRLEESDSLDPKLPQQLSQTGLFSDTASLTPAEGMIEYEVNSPLWSDGAIKRRWLALPTGQRIEFDTTEAWRFPVGTAFVKHFEFFVSPTATRRLETRVFLRQREGWIGFTYRWNEDETDADLLTERLSEDFQVDLGAGVQTQTWTYPSPNECMGCHTAAAGYVLGARTRQLNRIFGDENQLHAWNCMGVFEEDIGDPSALGSYANPADPTASLQQRARAYLAANCAICHQPLGPAPGGMDMRYAALLGGMNLIGVSPSEGDLGLPDPRRIKPGRSIESVLWQRLATTDPDVRMARGTLVPDTVGIQILAAWIDTGLFALDSDEDGISDEIDNCPRVPNALQRDTGGLDTLVPDGVGDACQCGDTDESGRVDQADTDSIRWGLADPFTAVTPGGQRRCVGADAFGRCTILDVVRLRRALQQAFPPIEQRCPAATEPGPLTSG